VFCSGQELPAHPCSLAWIKARRTAITLPNITNMIVLQISLIQDFKVQHNSRIYSDSRGRRMPNPDWARG